MPIFRKLIVTPQVYRVNTPKGRQIRAITKDTLREVAQVNQSMIDAGIKIPAPFAHKDDEGIVPSPMLDGEIDAQTKQKKRWSSDINGGFWKKFEATDEGLVGYVEVPDKVAEKLGNTIQETSVLLEPEWEDGLGRKWKNALRHVALVTNAVEPNQKNFELVDLSPEYSLAMSFSMNDAVGGDSSKPEKKDSDPSAKSPSETADTSSEDNKSDDSNDKDKDQLGSGNIPEIVSLLKDKLDYELPSDTTAENFLDRLRVLLTSIKKDEEEEDDDFKVNPKSKEKPGDDDAEVRSSPAYMADESKNTDNLTILEKKSGKLLEKLQETFKALIAGRLQSALEAGKIGKRTFDNMTKELVTLTMSFEDFDEETGEFKKTKIEEKLEMAEDLAGFNGEQTTTNTLPNGGSVPPSPEDANTPKATQEELEAIYKLL
jgi:hypothetical protein